MNEVYSILVFVLWIPLSSGTVIQPISFANSRLLQVQYLVRHGDSSPRYTFLHDPHINFWVEGQGQLTSIGLKQHWELGKYLRQEYKTFLPIKFKKSEAYFQSIDDDRSISSAMIHLSSLYPPLNDLKSSLILGHQGVPLFNSPSSNDHFNAHFHCPRYTQWWQSYLHSPSFRFVEESYSKLYRTLATKTGQPYINLESAWKTCDTILSWVIHQLTTPEWLTESLLLQCRNVINLEYTLKYGGDSEIPSLRGRPMLGQLFVNIETRLNSTKPSGLLLAGYTGDADMLAALQSFLQVYNGIQPPEAAVLLVELYTNQESNFVRFRYRNSSDNEPVILRLPDCGRRDYCTLDELRILSGSKQSNTSTVQCIHKVNSTSDLRFFRTMIVILAILHAVIIIISLLFVYRRHYKRNCVIVISLLIFIGVLISLYFI